MGVEEVARRRWETETWSRDKKRSSKERSEKEY